MVLRCPVCLEALRRQPKCLPCGHVFCLTCLTAVFVKPVALPTGTAFGGLRCPLCRDLSFRAPRDLPTLFAVADLAETSPGGSLLLSRDTAGEEGETATSAPPTSPAETSLRELAENNYTSIVLLPLVQVVLDHATREATRGRDRVKLDPALSRLVLEHWTDVYDYLTRRAGAVEMCADSPESVTVIFFDRRRRSKCRRVAFFAYVVAAALLSVFQW